MSVVQLQGDAAWHGKRAGRITASRFKDVIAFVEDAKGNRRPTAARTTYMHELAFERLAEQAKHNVRSKSLDWGHENEKPSHEAYELQTGNVVTYVDFIVHPRYDWLGCSPDGLIGDDGGIESKNPYSEAVHVKTWLEGMPEEHKAQVQGCMLVTGRKWWDFLSFDIRQHEKVQLYIEHVQRDDEYCEWLLVELVRFNLELDRMVAEILYKADAQAERLAQ